jgi:hypothetical protein
MKLDGANMFILGLGKSGGGRDAMLLATGKPVMCLKTRRLSPGFALKGNQL